MEKNRFHAVESLNFMVWNKQISRYEINRFQRIGIGKQIKTRTWDVQVHVLADFHLKIVHQLHFSIFLDFVVQITISISNGMAILMHWAIGHSSATQTFDDGFGGIENPPEKSSKSVHSDGHFVGFFTFFLVASHVSKTAEQQGQKQIENDQIGH